MASDADSSHYFSAAPTTPSRPRTIRFVERFGGGDLTTDRAVFSADRIDLGTRVLLSEVPDPPPAGTFCDLGCGYGPIAVALATASPDALVVAVDINERARELCRQNAEDRDLTNIEVPAPENVDPDLRFDLIWSNPPIRIGKEPLHDLLMGWLGRLAADGEAYLVIQRHLGADSLHRWLEDQAFEVTRIASKKGYRLLRVQVNSGSNP